MSLLRSSFVVALGTLLSRILGLVRDILLARLLGAGDVADAWVAAFRFPNLFRNIIAEGAFNAAFLPQFTRLYVQDQQSHTAKQFAQTVLGRFGLMLLLGIGILQIFMPWVVVLFVPGYAVDLWQGDSWMLPGGDKFLLTTDLMMICLPYAFLMFILALYGGCLNSLGNFWLAALSPVLFNIVVIIVLFFCQGMSDKNSVYWLAYGIILSGIMQAGLAIWLLARMKIFLYPALAINCRKLQMALGRFYRLFLPGMIAGGAAQLNIMIGGMIASFQAGAMSYLYYADRIYQLPLGLIGATIGTVLLPTLSRGFTQADKRNFFKLQNQSLLASMLLTLPSMAGILVISLPIVRLLFERGDFSTEDSIYTAQALWIYAFGLPAFIVTKILAASSFAAENTKLPMHCGLIGIVANILCSLLLFPYMGHVGIALATVIAAWLNTVLLWSTLYRQQNISITTRSWRCFGGMVLAAAMMAGGVWLFDNFLQHYALSISIVCCFDIIMGIILYGGGMWLFGGYDRHVIGNIGINIFKKRGTE